MRTDEQLIVEFQAGTVKAFDELFQRYRNPIYRFFRRRLTDTARAEDMAQETFLIVLRGAERYEPKATFRTYLYAVALKLLWTERRRNLRETRLMHESPQQPQRDDSSMEVWVRDALDRLDADHREVLMLREYEQLAYDEIADLLDIPVNTVRSRLFRARTQLKALLEPQTTKEAAR